MLWAVQLALRAHMRSRGHPLALPVPREALAQQLPPRARALVATRAPALAVPSSAQVRLFPAVQLLDG
jgi:hypothetical protein